MDNCLPREELQGTARLSQGSGGGVSGGWRDAFLNRHRRGSSVDAVDLANSSGDTGRCSLRHRVGTEGRARSASRPRVPSQPPVANRNGEGTAISAGEFDQQAVLDQDRLLIEQLTQRQPRRELSVVRKPPPPPKIVPYRARAEPSGTPATTPPSTLPNTASSQSSSNAPHTPMPLPLPSGRSPMPNDVELPLQPGGSDLCTTTPLLPTHSETAGDSVVASASSLHDSTHARAAQLDKMAGRPATCDRGRSPAAVDDTAPTRCSVEQARADAAKATSRADATLLAGAGLAIATSTTHGAKPATFVEPVVPRSGEMFTAEDIDVIMNRIAGGSGHMPSGGGAVQDDAVSALVCGGGGGAGTPAAGQVTQNASDLSNDFFCSHHMEVPVASASCHDASATSNRKKLVGPGDLDVEVLQRRKLQHQIQAIDSWLEDDFAAREQLAQTSADGQSLGNTNIGLLADLASKELSVQLAAATGATPVSNDGLHTNDAAAELLQKLEDLKRRKALGEKASVAVLKGLAQIAKPLFPTMKLEILVRVLHLFTSARHEDHDLYLRILGEIPMQIRGITPEMLTTCMRVLWRLRLREETYLELLTMEAMNMIRSARRPVARAPRRPPALRTDTAATAAVKDGTLRAPIPPPVSSAEALSPFSARQLVHMGNALTQLGCKLPARFMERYQEQLSRAIPRLAVEECELVCPTFAMSQLMHDPLRRAFLERCAEVGAGKQFPLNQDEAANAAPDIAQYQRELQERRRRVKRFRNIYVVEASVRKETFSFFSSLPNEVRAYLDRVRADASQLPHEEPSALAFEVAGVLDQLGVTCDTNRMAGPLGLHVVASAVRPGVGNTEVVYECSDSSDFYALRQDDKGAAPQLVASVKLRHKLLQRLGVQLIHINAREWHAMSEAQRVNYMVRLQSFE